MTMTESRAAEMLSDAGVTALCWEKAISFLPDRQIHAIKTLREEANWGLRQSKDFIDWFRGPSALNPHTTLQTLVDLDNSLIGLRAARVYASWVYGDPEVADAILEIARQRSETQVINALRRKDMSDDEIIETHRSINGATGAALERLQVFCEIAL